MKTPSVQFKKTFKKKGKTNKKNKPIVPIALKQYVKKAIALNVENKHAIPQIRNNLTIHGYGQSPNGPHQLSCEDLSTVFQGIVAGPEDGQRIGDTIKVKHLSLKGFINLDSTKANNDTFSKNPVLVKMFVGRRVDTNLNPNTYATTGSTGFDDLFLNGPTTINPSNLPSDMYRMINKNIYRIYATRYFKIGTSAPSNTPSTSAQWNNDFSFSRNFSINLNKNIHTVKYSPDGTVSPNAAFYCWFLVSFANGSSMNSVDNDLPLEWHYDLNCVYEDA